MFYIKYGRTYHLEWSKGVQSDDKIIKDLSHFSGMEIVVLEKLDGENTTLYPDYYHARSIDSKFNFTRAWVAKMHSVLRFDIPDDLRIVGENMWAEHSIRYKNLEGYLYLLSIWRTNEDPTLDMCLSYDETMEYAELFDLPVPKVLYRGVYDETILREIAQNLDTDIMEGYVIRNVESFSRADMSKNMAKFVREGHVQPDADHWLKNAKQNGELIKPVKPSFMS